MWHLIFQPEFPSFPCKWEGPLFTANVLFGQQSALIRLVFVALTHKKTVFFSFKRAPALPKIRFFGPCPVLIGVASLSPCLILSIHITEPCFRVTPSSNSVFCSPSNPFDSYYGAVFSSNTVKQLSVL